MELFQEILTEYEASAKPPHIKITLERQFLKFFSSDLQDLPQNQTGGDWFAKRAKTFNSRPGKLLRY